MCCFYHNASADHIFPPTLSPPGKPFQYISPAGDLYNSPTKGIAISNRVRYMYESLCWFNNIDFLVKEGEKK